MHDNPYRAEEGNEADKPRSQSRREWRWQTRHYLAGTLAGSGIGFMFGWYLAGGSNDVLVWIFCFAAIAIGSSIVYYDPFHRR